MVDYIKPHIIGITESWANNDITYAELGLEGYVMFRKDIMGRRGGGVLLYIKETIPAYEVQLQEEADCNEAIWCKLVTGHTTVTIGVGRVIWGKAPPPPNLTTNLRMPVSPTHD